MILHLLDTGEVVSPQPFGADSPVVSFDIDILLRFARLYVDQRDPSVLRPGLKSATDVFSAVVHTNG